MAYHGYWHWRDTLTGSGGDARPQPERRQRQRRLMVVVADLAPYRIGDGVLGGFTGVQSPADFLPVWMSINGRDRLRRQVWICPESVYLSIRHLPLRLVADASKQRRKRTAGTSERPSLLLAPCCPVKRSWNANVSPPPSPPLSGWENNNVHPRVAWAPASHSPFYNLMNRLNISAENRPIPA